MNILVKPKETQVKAYNFFKKRDRGIVNFSTGTGKSFINILLGLRLLKLNKIDKYIIVCTKSAMVSIIDDFKKLTNCKFFEIQNEKDFRDFFNSDIKFGVLKYKTIYIFGLPLFHSYFSKYRIGVGFDEVHTLKNYKSKVGKYWRTIRPFIKYCYGFTATLISSSLEDLYSIVDFISPKFFGSFNSFREMYMNYTEITVRRNISGDKRNKILVPSKIKVIESYKNLEDLTERLSNIVINYFPIQNINFLEKEYYLESSTFKAYSSLVDEKFSNFKNDDGSVMDAMVSLQKFLDNTKEKKQAYIDLIQTQLEYGCLTYCSFIETTKILKDLLNQYNIENELIDGSLSLKERKRIKEWFTNNSKNKVLLLTDAGGQSLNLQATPYFNFYNIPFGIGKFQQSIGRIVREFSNFKTFNISFLYSINTIDQYKKIYIEMNRDAILKLFKCEIVPKGRFNDYSFYLAKNIRKNVLWRS